MGLEARLVSPGASGRTRAAVSAATLDSRLCVSCCGAVAHLTAGWNVSGGGSRTSGPKARPSRGLGKGRLRPSTAHSPWWGRRRI